MDRRITLDRRAVIKAVVLRPNIAKAYAAYALTQGRGAVFANLPCGRIEVRTWSRNT